MLPKPVSPTLLPPIYPIETGGFSLVSKKIQLFHTLHHYTKQKKMEYKNLNNGAQTLRQLQ